MSMTLDEINQGLKNLSVVELANLIEHAAAELRHKTAPNGNGIAENVAQNRIHIPGAYTLSKEEIKHHLESMFTSEELEEAAKVDISKLPPLPKTITEYLSEDREDRF